ncbi:Calpain-B [Trichoplax sp. H2]|nr:Calpain-B [Trichoplax sp. H2]|eukprot:RDD43006.1 Calpain-B [Trichoplax sp. H2]
MTSPSGTVKKYLNQDYQKIKLDCLNNGQLFEDPTFPPTDATLFFSQKPPRRFVWKRPGELSKNPKLFVDGASRLDICQGMLGDCWFLAAISSLAGEKSLLYRVVPPDQSFSRNYAGIFHFQFWRFGQWTDVIIDDLLPTYNGRLIFVHSADTNEYWSALLEKAYAKLAGSYEALKGGHSSEALEDFTGGVTEVIDLKKPPNNLFDQILKSFERHSLMGCSIEASPNQIEHKLDNGLVMGHAYSVSKAVRVKVRGRSEEDLIRIRNPWGNEKEWRGAWGDGSPEWKTISEAEKAKMELSFDDDGEFWMAFKDFCAEFSTLEICMLSPDSAVDSRSSKKRWQMQKHNGAWQKGVSAGGCRNYPDTFHYNPQVAVEITDEDDEEGASVFISLMQKNRRKLKSQNAKMLTIGFALYKLDQRDASKKLDKNYFLYHASTAKSKTFINMREVATRFNLPKGTYVIMPSTFNPHESGEFLLRVFTEKPATCSGEVDDDCQYVAPAPQVQSRQTPEEMRLENAFHEIFDRVAGTDEEVDAFELQQILNQGLVKMFGQSSATFSLEACRSMVAMVDQDRSGKLNYDEFRNLWQTIKSWKDNFQKFDTDKSGSFSSYELRAALTASGFRLSTSVMRSIALRYASKDGSICFNDYLLCMMKVTTMFDKFIEHDASKRGKAQFSLDQFLSSTMLS